MEVLVTNNQKNIVYGKTFENIAIKAIDAAALVCNVEERSEVGVMLTDNAYIQELNRVYRNRDYPTDVLSFAMNEKGEGEPDFELPEQINILGDIVISLEKAFEQGEEYGHGIKRELGYLIVHGFLHLLGYDHETEAQKQIMRQIEEKILTELNWER
ncbi:MAG: rRNA maturation RNase YbeY [Syntrophomonadaceae bacterium]|jgi:probable rRNA maturation factor|nr:rRNA maturation RNase YbeY [Syntrophomonadaceae bacterium]